MMWALLAVWGASLATGYYVGKQRGTAEDGIGLTFLFGPVGLLLYGGLEAWRASRREPVGQPRTQPE